MPDVYWIWAGMSGVTSGSAAAALPDGADAANSAQSLKLIVSRRSSRSGWTCSSDVAIGLPRNSVT